MIRVAVPGSYSSERRYIADVLLSEFLGLECRVEVEQRTDVALRLAGATGELRLPNGLFGLEPAQWLTPASVPRSVSWWTLPPNLRSLGSPVSIPLLFDDSAAERYVVSGDVVHLNIDVFGAAFFMLTRYEEVADAVRDRHERFPASASLAMRAGYLHRPIVNELLEVMWLAMSALWPRLERRSREFRVFLTHDVDRPLGTYGQPADQIIRQFGGDLVRRGDVRTAVRRLRSAYRVRRRGAKADLNYTFPAIMRSSEALGYRSAFYFMTGRTAGAIDGSYEIHDAPIRQLIAEIHARGHEIGLHPSYNTFRTPSALCTEFARLRRVAETVGVTQVAWGGRQHYLRWEAPTTWRLWNDVGLDYDSSVGFAEQSGFRCGTCYEFPVFDVTQSKQLRLRERPLVVMDVSLTSPEYMALGSDDALQVVSDLVDSCRQHRGDFVLLWHNDHLVTDGQQKLYRRVLEMLS